MHQVGWPGGVPVWLDQHVIGAFGVSGGGDDQDESLAIIGVETLAKILGR